MTRAEIKEEAKQMVLSHGPSNVLEFGSEMVVTHAFGGLDAPAELREAILTEARKQAHRVYDFLGYEAPWATEVPMIQRGDI
jgi:hypothetical protein